MHIYGTISLIIKSDAENSMLVYICVGGYVVVQEKLPNYVVPDLTDFKVICSCFFFFLFIASYVNSCNLLDHFI